MRMESVLLFRIVQMPVTGVPNRNHCRLHRDNVKQKVPAEMVIAFAGHKNQCRHKSVP